MSETVDPVDLMPPRGDAVEFSEPRRPDRNLPKLLFVHRRRLEISERKAILARARWRELRTAIEETRQEWQTAKQHAQDFWITSRADFFRMTITSGMFRAAKGTYERKKAEAESIHLLAREAAQAARTAGREFFAARTALHAQQLRCEKFALLQKLLTANQNDEY